jgi:universal stress protein E
MQKFHNILFLSYGIADETEVLEQTLSLACNNKAALKALLICPALPAEMADYKDKYEASLKDQLSKSIQASRDTVIVNGSDCGYQSRSMNDSVCILLLILFVDLDPDQIGPGP